MFSNQIKRKIGSLYIERNSRIFHIQYKKGSITPYIIKTKTGEVVFEFSNEKEAKRKLMASSYGLGIEANKNKEVIVHLRLQTGMDKDELMEYAKDKFNVTDYDAERLFFEAFPEGVDLEETKLLCEIDDAMEKEDLAPMNFINQIFEHILGNEELKVETVTPLVTDKVKLIVTAMLRKRNLI